MFTTKPSIVNLLLRFGPVLSVYCCNPLFMSFCCLLSVHGRKSIKLDLLTHFSCIFVHCIAQPLFGILIMTVNNLTKSFRPVVCYLVTTVFRMLLFLQRFHACVSKSKQTSRWQATYIYIYIYIFIYIFIYIYMYVCIYIYNIYIYIFIYIYTCHICIHVIYVTYNIYVNIY